ncbi:unnamed protein product [Adineta ricciae]|uniref:Uncharacterized protein n=1 Tax=Adineta ricciae TaxID=249248 RepID=A0A815N7T8_ADIRI|nr:unnamed protein product [Adineta ricciae]
MFVNHHHHYQQEHFQQSQNLITAYGHPKTVRPPDSLFLEVAQRCASIETQYGNIDVNQIIRSSHTISSHIHELTDHERAQLRKLLASSVKNWFTLCITRLMD